MDVTGAPLRDTTEYQDSDGSFTDGLPPSVDPCQEFAERVAENWFMTPLASRNLVTLIADELRAGGWSERARLRDHSSDEISG